MKSLIPILLLVAAPLFAETVIVKESTMLKAERAALSIKAGTEVELLARDADTVTVRYRNVTGKIPASKLEGGTKTAEAPKAEEKKPLPGDGQDKSRAGSSPQREFAGQTPGAQQPATTPARPPQTMYGKAVQKAKDNAAAHEKNAVKPTDEIMKN